MYSLSLFSLTQIVMSATHDNPNGSSSLIDLVFLSNQSSLRSCNIIPPLSNSDHKGLLIELLKLSTTLQPTRHPRTVWNYAKADFNKARYLISSTNWESIMSEDVNVSLILWQTWFLDIMKE